MTSPDDVDYGMCIWCLELIVLNPFVGLWQSGDDGLHCVSAGPEQDYLHLPVTVLGAARKRLVVEGLIDVLRDLEQL